MVALLPLAFGLPTIITVDTPVALRWGTNTAVIAAYVRRGTSFLD